MTESISTPSSPAEPPARGPATGAEPSFSTPVRPAVGDFNEPSLPRASMAADPAMPDAVPAESAKLAPPVERIPVWQAEITAMHGALDETRKRLNHVRWVYALAGLLGLVVLVVQHLQIVDLRGGLFMAQQRADTLSAALTMQQANLAQLEQRVAGGVPHRPPLRRIPR